MRGTLKAHSCILPVQEVFFLHCWNLDKKNHNLFSRIFLSIVRVYNHDVPWEVYDL